MRLTDLSHYQADMPSCNSNVHFASCVTPQMFFFVCLQMFEAIRNRHFTTVFDLLKKQATELQTVSDVSFHMDESFQN